ncbi:MAG TPA: hypothetical protein VHZ55_27590 [Bryobacteraceae bacterium]|jgi:hypothetical protein|nr:hypothetical protein [Bryobacteraceae bacterium]
MKDYLQQMEDWTRACGARAGIIWGEAFWQYTVHPYPQEPLLEQALLPYLAKGLTVSVSESEGTGKIEIVSGPSGRDFSCDPNLSFLMLPSACLAELMD